jgi:hypothetical protein
LLATFSLYYQYLFGPISWFAEYAGRSSTNRYSSLLGSLTVYGGFISVPILVSALIVKNRFLAILLIFLFIVGSFLSLQKMSIASLAMAFGFLLHYQDSKVLSAKFLNILYYVCALLVFFLVIYSIGVSNLPDHLNYYANVFTDNASSVGDVSVGQSVAERFSELPFFAINFWGIHNLIFGVGVYGGSGGLGYPEFPMAHNLLFELILIFGLPLALAIFSFFCFLLIRFLLLPKSLQTSRLRLSVCVFSSLLVTSMFSGGLLYQPILAIPFWFAFSDLCRHRYLFSSLKFGQKR